jgi:hypothetical protein
MHAGERWVFRAMIKRLMRFAAQHSPKGIDVIFAAQYGIMECLGMPRYWELVIPIIKQQFRQLIGRPFHGLQRPNKGTTRGNR